jgi:hypothetical protein
MDQTSTELNAKEAVSAARGYFVDFMSEFGPRNVLLEGLVYHEDDRCWEVTFSFDIGRKKSRTKNSSVLNLFGEEEVETSLEIRRIFVRASDGGFLKMESD